MANLSVYYNNGISTPDATVSGSGFDPAGSHNYAADERLSFKTTTTGIQATIHIDAGPGSAIDPFQFVVLADHAGMEGGGSIAVTSYPTAARTGGTVLVSGSIPATDPAIIDAGSLQTETFHLDVKIIASGLPNTAAHANFGELMLARKFTSPRGPAPGILTSRVPRIEFIDLPNGERQSIRNAGVCRIKSYTIQNLSAEQAAEWIDLFVENEGSRLVVLEDDDGDLYPCLMNTTLEVDKNSGLYTIGLGFTEVNLG